MSGKLVMTLGQDLSCYAEVVIPSGSDLSRDNLIRIANEAVCNEVFDADWSTCCALRIVAVSDGNGTNLVEDLIIEPTPFDAGQQLSLFLHGHVELDELLTAVSEYGLIPSIEMESMLGRICLPSDQLELQFLVRKGATLVEKDLAFFHALCQIADVEYKEASQETEGAVHE